MKQMATIRDICRICLQEVNYDNVQEIDLDKLRHLIVKSLLPKWEIRLFHDHIVCNTCIDNFRTLRALYGYAWKANSLIMRMRQKSNKCSQQKDVDLRQLSKFDQICGDFFVCRLCLDPVKHIAVYLSDNPYNILPGTYIKMMLKSTRLYLTLLEKTINPVLCYQCWQRVQVAFSFRKHLEIVTDKLQYYRQLHSKTDINKADLEDILHMWDILGQTDTENIPMESDTSISHIRSPIEQSKNMPWLKPHYAFFEEHNYSSKSSLINIINQSVTTGDQIGAINNQTRDRSSLNEVQSNMPVLMPSVKEDVKERKICILSNKLLRKKKANEELDKFVVNSPKAIRKQHKNSLSNLKKKHNEDCTTLSKYIEKPVSILKPKEQRNQEYNGTFKKINTSKDGLRRRTRLSARKEEINELNSKELLILKKEEIIKKKPFRNLKSIIPSHTSTPITKEINTNVQSKKSPLKQSSSNGYTFERLNYDNEVQFDQSTIEEEEIQIKREVISDSDDDFFENTLNEVESIREDQCPNLDAFIKTEPEEIIDVNDEGEGEPPELEFQGPCSYDPKFVISNTFSVNDKRYSNNTDDEKKELISSKERVTKSSLPIRRNPMYVPNQRSLLKSNIGKITKKTLLLKDNKYSIAGYKPLFRDVVINLTKCDKNATLQFESVNADMPIKPANVENKKGDSDVTFNSKTTRVIAQSRNKTPVKIQPARFKMIPKIVPAHFKPIPLLQTEPVASQNSCTVNAEQTKRSLPNKKKKLKNGGGETSPTVPVSKNEYFNEFYTEIDNLIINKTNPYICRICDFLTFSRKGAKCHVSLHATNSVRLYVCEQCSYQTTKKTSLNSHMNRAHKPKKFTRPAPTCVYCNLPDTQAKCQKCRKSFHPECLLGKQKLFKSGCNHFNVSGCMTISSTGSVTMTTDICKETRLCSFCLKCLNNWVDCEQCKKYFHYRCFFFSRNDLDNTCLHSIDLTNQELCQMDDQNDPEKNASFNDTSLDNQAKKKEEHRKCDFCTDTLYSVIPCPNCLKFMHHLCYLKDSKEMKFNCKHVDIIGETPQVICGYCGLSVQKNSVICKLCNRTLHRACFIMDRVKMTLNCEHFADTDLTAIRKKPYLNDTNERSSKGTLN